MKFRWIAALVVCAGSSFATEVGTFSNYRLYFSAYNLVTSPDMSTYGNMWLAGGTVWHQTDTLTPEFLSTVTVFVTSKIGTINYTQAEVDALADWVRNGGTLVMMGECACYATHPMYNTLLAPYQISLWGADVIGTGTVIASHRLTQGLSQVYIAKNGQVTAPAEATRLVNDSSGYLASIVMEQTPIVGKGRLFLIADCDMFDNNHQGWEPTANAYAQNIVNWALHPGASLSGTVSAENISGSLAGVPMTLDCYQNQQVVDTKTVALDASGHYSVSFDQPSTCTIVAKLPQWLSVRASDVVVAEGTNLDWYFPINGDATHDNSVDLFDFNTIVTNFGSTGPNDADLDMDDIVSMFDLNLIFLNFGSTGE